VSEPAATPAPPTRVLVVDDHPLFRRGLMAVLGREPDLAVVGEAGDGAEALARAEELAPDVVLLDVRLPDMSGPATCAALKARRPRTGVIMLTVSDEESDLYGSVRAGATGYLLKTMPADELADAVRAVAAGHSLISPAMASKLLTEFATMIKRADDRPGGQAARLTPRELEVLRLVARGLNNRDIARELFISENTVKNHVRNMLEKLQLHSRMEVVVYAVREKLLEIS